MWGNIQHASLGQEIVIDSMQKTKHSVRVPLSDIALSWLPTRIEAVNRLSDFFGQS